MVVSPACPPPVQVEVGVGVIVGESVEVGVAVIVAVAVLVSVAVAVAVAVLVGVEVTVAVAVVVPVAVGVPVIVGVLVGPGGLGLEGLLLDGQPDRITHPVKRVVAKTAKRDFDIFAPLLWGTAESITGNLNRGGS